MNEELALRLVLWLIFLSGSLAIVAGCLYASLWLLGKILKMTGYWNVTLRAMQKVYAERRKKESK